MMKPDYDHCCFIVQDINKSIQFYRDVIGLEYIEGPIEMGEGSGVDTIVGYSNAHIKRAGLRLSDSCWLELIQYIVPSGLKTAVNERCDVGSAHIAFWVDDLTKDYQELTGKGVRFVSPPSRTSTGLLVTYCFDPDGFILELKERRKPKQ